MLGVGGGSYFIVIFCERRRCR